MGKPECEVELEPWKRSQVAITNVLHWQQHLAEGGLGILRRALWGAVRIDAFF